MWKLLAFDPRKWRKEKTCKLCGEKSVTISEVIGVCATCLRSNPTDSLKIALKAHYKSKKLYNLPGEPPRDEKGVVCRNCANECSIGEGNVGFCGLVENRKGRLRWRVKLPYQAVVDWYYDPIPTNCVAGDFCPATTGVGYPKYAKAPRGEHGYYNLAVFYGACNLDCIFCQNWTYRNNTLKLSPVKNYQELVNAADGRVTCICFFGGDPTPQLSHAFLVAKKALERAKQENRVMRICWETNGLMSKNLLKEIVKISLESGGIIKFDVKAWSEPIYKALTGVSNRKLFDNIAFIAEHIKDRPEVPLFMASTLLVPGYVDEYEIRMISRFIARLDPSIPYRLLAFHPDYMLVDLPPTSKKHAMNAVKIAKEEGLENVSIGNIWLLGDYY
ncbi:MAG: radical SAM protein [Thermoprotei archaeon]|nr:MAG: radical SAM protein [Thermoprotei archaeon]